MNFQPDIFDPQTELDFDSEPVSRDQMLSELVGAVLAEIRRGKSGKLQMPWSRSAGFPVNARTGEPFHGRNLLLLWASASRNDFRSNRWATLKQWSALGARVQKGERATRVFRGIDIPEEKKDESADSLIFRPYPVFNADQVSYRNPGQGELFEPSPAFDGTKAIELIALSGAEIVHQGVTARYNRRLDKIFVPPRSAFIGSRTSGADESYYRIVLHELVHWTGHTTRCARKVTGGFDSESYAFEELVAEIGSTILCLYLRITPEVRDDHVLYIEGWKRTLEHEPEALVRAAEQAKTAVDYLQGFGGRLFV